METTNNLNVSSHISEGDEIPCPFSVQKNMVAFAQRHSLDALRDKAMSYKYASYSSFDQAKNPNSKSF